MQPIERHFDAPNPHGTPGTHAVVFYEWGDPFAPPVICVHGLTRNGRDFDYLAQRLARKYRLIAVDIAGRGKSEKFSNIQWYENGVYMQDMMALTEHLNLARFDWIGTSMGGMIGMMIAAFMPEKINRLILNDIGAMVPKEGLLRIAEYAGRNMEFTSCEEAETYLRRVMLPFGISQEEHWLHIFEHTFVRDTHGGCRLAYDAGIGDIFRQNLSAMEKLEDISLWKLWEIITCPTLILRGAQSDVLPQAVAQKMCNMQPRATMVEFAGVGHAPALMDDAQIEVIAKWLEQSPHA